MARGRLNIFFISGSVIVVLIALGAMAHQSMGLRKWRTGFNEEMAQRLDLEEKFSRMEKERSVLMADLNQASSLLEKANAENDVLRATLVREMDEKKALADRLVQAQALPVTSMTKSVP
jgi:hypothetical protein